MGYVPFHSRGFVFDDSYSEEVLLSRLQDIQTLFKASMLNIIANLINFVLDKDLACFEQRSDQDKNTTKRMVSLKASQHRHYKAFNVISLQRGLPL